MVNHLVPKFGLLMYYCTFSTSTISSIPPASLNTIAAPWNELAGGLQSSHVTRPGCSSNFIFEVRILVWGLVLENKLVNLS